MGLGFRVSGVLLVSLTLPASAQTVVDGIPSVPRLSVRPNLSRQRRAARQPLAGFGAGNRHGAIRSRTGTQRTGLELRSGLPINSSLSPV
jgi:hypothetical protein